MKARLKDLGTIFTGNTPSKRVDEYWDNNDIKFIKPDIIKDELCVISSANEYISAGAKNASRIVPANSVLVTCIGNIGRVGITEEEVAFNQQINAIVPNRIIIPKYLAYAIYANRKQLRAIANAPVVPIINKTQFSNFEISICESIEKQNKIVRILDAISEIIARNKKKIEELDNLIKARFVEMFGNLENNEFNYSVKRIQEVCEQIKDGTHQTPTYTDDNQSGYIFLSSKDVTSGKVDWCHPKYIPENLHRELYARISPKKGDILLAKNGTTGVAAIVDKEIVFDIYVSLALLRPLDVNEVYLWAAINSDDTKKQFNSSLKGIGVPNLHLREIKETKIIVPPIKIQNEFATFVAQVDKSKFAVQKSLEKTQLLFDSLMQEYF